MTQRDIKNRALDFNVMLAHKFDAKRINASTWAKHVVAEPKHDGVRVIVICKLHKNHVAYYSRNGRQLFMFAHLDKDVKRFATKAYHSYDAHFADGIVLDCEVTHLSKEFEQIAGAIHRKDHTEFDARLHVFHAMPLETFMSGSDTVSMYKRMQMCRFIIKSLRLKMLSYSNGIVCTNEAEVRQAYADHIRAGHEGTMVKLTDHVWQGKRSHAWMKIKPEDTEDVEIIGMKPGKGKYAGTLGALVYKYKGKRCSMSGMTDEQRRRWWRERNTDNSVVGRMMEVKFSRLTTGGIPRHPRFKRFREDKQPSKTA